MIYANILAKLFDFSVFLALLYNTNIDKNDKNDNMLSLFSNIIDLFRHESPQERYARACHEAEQEEQKQRKEKEFLTRGHE